MTEGDTLQALDVLPDDRRPAIAAPSARPRVSRTGLASSRRWLPAGGTAVIVHLAVLGVILALPHRATHDDEATPVAVVVLETAPEAAASVPQEQAPAAPEPPTPETPAQSEVQPQPPPPPAETPPPEAEAPPPPPVEPMAPPPPTGRVSAATASAGTAATTAAHSGSTPTASAGPKPPFLSATDGARHSRPDGEPCRTSGGFVRSGNPSASGSAGATTFGE